jgi:hypothetical protein
MVAYNDHKPIMTSSEPLLDTCNYGLNVWLTLGAH